MAQWQIRESSQVESRKFKLETPIIEQALNKSLADYWTLTINKEKERVGGRRVRLWKWILNEPT